MTKELLLNVVYSALLFWLIFSAYYIYKLWLKKSSQDYNPYLYNSIPSIFTTIGILGTFGGIYIGLKNFNVQDIDSSIPMLLEGMKLAFLTSILGIMLSIVSRIIGQLVLRSVELNEPPISTSELTALNQISTVLSLTKDEIILGSGNLLNSISGTNKSSLSNQFKEFRKQFSLSESEKEQRFGEVKNIITGIDQKMTKSLQNWENIKDGLIGENSLTTQIEAIHESQNTNNLKLREKIDQFEDTLKKNNTEALLEVMKKATETFNAQMSELIQKLVQENFSELNQSVSNLNSWQKENKEMISSLTRQFISVSENIESTSSSIEKITKNTSRLTEENSKLNTMIAELQKVLIEDTKFQNIVSTMDQTISKVEKNVIAFDETTVKLNDWIKKEHTLKQSVIILIDRLNEIEKIRDINGEFWNNTKIQMEEGVSIISNSSELLRNNLDSISEEFTKQLSQTLQSLDELIQRLVAKN